LLEKGYVASIGEAFERYIGFTGPAYVARYKLTPVEAVKVITARKGLPVLAHPRGQEHVLAELVDAGLAGLEAYYPGYAIEESEALVRLAKKHDLVPTGGTDFHGYHGFGTVAVGEVWVPLESVERLRALVMNRVGLVRQQ
jgi:predicted metal-dependent phosphoesterase TrpH